MRPVHSAPAFPFPDVPWPPPFDPAALLEACRASEIAVLTSLFLGGHLVEADAEAFWISDNAHSRDGETFLATLQRLGCPLNRTHLRWLERVPRAELASAISRHDPVELVGRILGDRARRGSEECGPYVPPEEAIRRAHGPKVDLRYLDRDVALLVKGLSACGVMTSYSCAGHAAHAPNRYALVNGSSEVDLAWADVLLQTYGHAGAGTHLAPVRVAPQARRRVEEFARKAHSALLTWRTRQIVGPHFDDRPGAEAMRRLGGALYLHREEARACRAELIEESRTLFPDFPHSQAFVRLCRARCEEARAGLRRPHP